MLKTPGNKGLRSYGFPFLESSGNVDQDLSYSRRVVLLLFPAPPGPRTVQREPLLWGTTVSHAGAPTLQLCSRGETLWGEAGAVAEAPYTGTNGD